MRMDQREETGTGARQGEAAAGAKITAELEAKAALGCFIGIRRVCEIAGFSKASILRRQKRGEFPQPVVVDGNVVRYDLAEVLAWRREQFEKREQRLAQQRAAGTKENSR